MVQDSKPLNHKVKCPACGGSRKWKLLGKRKIVETEIMNSEKSSEATTVFAVVTQVLSNLTREVEDNPGQFAVTVSHVISEDDPVEHANQYEFDFDRWHVRVLSSDTNPNVVEGTISTSDGVNMIHLHPPLLNLIMEKIIKPLRSR